MKVYFDQMIWDKVIDKGIPACELKGILESKKISLYLGTHNIYEFAKCFIDETKKKNIKRGEVIFKYLNEFDTSCILKSVKELIVSDLIKARTGGGLLPCFDNTNTAATKREIWRLANGHTVEAKNYINKREEDFNQDAINHGNGVRKQLRDIPLPKYYEEFRDDFKYRHAVLNAGEFSKEAYYLSDSLLFSNPEKYPILNTYINAELYFIYLALSEPQGPSMRQTPDYRHLICANAVDLFVTNDNPLLNNSKKLSPYHLQLKNWDSFNSENLNP